MHEIALMLLEILKWHQSLEPEIEVVPFTNDVERENEIDTIPISWQLRNF